LRVKTFSICIFGGKNSRRRQWINLVGFEVVTAVSTKIAFFWVVAPCSPVEVYRGPCCLHALMKEAASTSETLVNFY
jgi:hypothetical protein